MSVENPVVESFDWAARRIYLKAGVTRFNWIDDIYKEHRAARHDDLFNARVDPLIKAYGNVNKGGGKATPRYTILQQGAKVVLADDGLPVEALVECITDDPDNDPSLIDDSNITQSKVFTPAAAETEIIYVSSGSGGSSSLTADEIATAVVNKVIS